MYCILDTETSKWGQNALQIIPKFWTVLQINENNETDRQCFTRVDEVMQYFLQLFLVEKHQFRIYIHNLDFDIKFLLDYMLKQHMNLKITKNHSMLSCKVQTLFTSKDRITKQLKQKYTTKFEFRDSCILFYHLSLKKLGRIVNLEKMECDYSDSDRAVFIAYSFRDCEILKRALDYLRAMFIRYGLDIEIEAFPLTLPAFSMKLFNKKNEGYNEVKIDENGKNHGQKNRFFDVSNDINHYFRRFYSGGRTEAFNFNTFDNVAVLDINSLYPAMMKDEAFHLPPYHYITENLEASIDDPRCFAFEVEFDDTFNQIPYAAEKGQKLLFLARSKHVLFTRQELEMFRTHITKFYGIWICAEHVCCFQYFEEIYQDKARLSLEHNPASELCKLPMNSTYGKFAEKPEKRDTKLIPHSLKETNNRLYLQYFTTCCNYSLLDESDTILFQFDTINHFTMQNVAFAWLITNNARLCLWKWMNTFIQRGCTLIYCDTDSIFIPLSDLCRVEPFLDKSKLGFFKLDKIVSNFQVVGSKEYIYTTQMDSLLAFLDVRFQQKAKGLTDGNLVEYTFSECTTIRPAKFSECYRRKLNIDTAIEVKKHKSTFYDKRWINTDLTTSPLISDHLPADNSERIINQLIRYYESFSYLFDHPIDVYHDVSHDHFIEKRKKLHYHEGKRVATKRRHLESAAVLNDDFIDPSVYGENFDPRLSVEENYLNTKAQIRDMGR